MEYLHGESGDWGHGILRGSSGIFPRMTRLDD